MAEDYGMKVSLAGYSVLTATNLQLAMKSSISMQKVKLMGTTTVESSTEGSVTHNLGYVPQFLVFGEDPLNAGTMNIGNASSSYSKVQAYADTTKVYWFIDYAGGPFDIYYYVFYDAA